MKSRWPDWRPDMRKLVASGPNPVALATPQVARSSPVLFNLYFFMIVDECPTLEFVQFQKVPDTIILDWMHKHLTDKHLPGQFCTVMVHNNFQPHRREWDIPWYGQKTKSNLPLVHFHYLITLKNRPFAAGVTWPNFS